MGNMKKRLIFTISMSFLLIISSVTFAKEVPERFKGYDKGVSWKPVVPLRKVTFVNFDKDSYIDDYAYLAAVPTTVFYDKDMDRLFSYPLLYYTDPYPVKEDKERSLNARPGIDYFMEDWMSYCNGRLDQMVLINVDKSKVKQWPARDVVEIRGNNSYEIAAKLALNDWSYSDKAVVAVIDESAKTNVKIVSGKVRGILPEAKLKEEHFEMQQTNRLNPTFHEFRVPDGYKHVKAEVWWDCLILGPGIMVPTGDPDIQLYCNYNDNWMQSSAASFWNIFSPPGHEFTSSYVYKPGKWMVGITDFPTEGNAPRKSFMGITIQGSLFKALFSKKVTYYVDVIMYPGVEIEIPDVPSLNSKDAKFVLSWNNPNVNLGFSIIGPAGENIFTEINESAEGSLEIDLEKFGGCLEGERYSIAVFSLQDLNTPIDFTVSYEWKEVNDSKERDSLTSASEGAVLASILNAPLLYTAPDHLPKVTEKALLKLGVREIYLISIGNHVSKSVEDKLKSLVKVKERLTELGKLYKKVMDLTGENDVIFTTIDPWTYYYVGELKPAGEWDKALFVGPASYLAAHHGSPTIIVDNHPKLTSSLVWHNEFWRRFCADRYHHPPSVAEMYLTGKRIYSFLKEYGFDREGMESIITIADQYDIGIPWDRIFPGVANSGRICGSPVDTSYWISRIVFYPALIFENPALKGEVRLINGSVSTRKPLGVVKRPFLNTLEIVRESGEESFKYPVLCSFVTHKHRFNERASKYYGAKYQCADGLIPGETDTMNPIDQGVGVQHLSKTGSCFPDLTESEVIPFYLKKAGYSAVFSTNFSAVTTNLNRGVILWIHGSHGEESDGGRTLFWDPRFDENFLAQIVRPFAGASKEPNPWRGYEWYLGSTEEPDTMTMDIKGMIPFTNLRIPMLPATGMDWALARKPIKELLNRLIPLVDPFEVENLYDGVIGTSFFSRFQYRWYNATQFDETLDNLHSAGFITSICQTSNTYFHLTLIRHGSVFQVQDPWPTSWYGAVWRQSIPRDIALGYTVGEAFTRGISHVGTLYTTDPPQWWWDMAENVVYFGDPDLRVWTPENEYSGQNHWDREDVEPLIWNGDEYSVDGHCLFGAISHPKARSYDLLPLYIVVIMVIAIIIAMVISLMKRK